MIEYKSLPDKLAKVTIPDQQKIENIINVFESGFDMYDVIKAEFFKNKMNYPTAEESSVYKICEHCGSKYKDQDAVEKRRKILRMIQNEENRLYSLFKSALFHFHKVDGENKRVQKAFEIAWDRGHASGYNEVAMLFDDMAEILKD